MPDYIQVAFVIVVSVHCVAPSVLSALVADWLITFVGAPVSARLFQRVFISTGAWVSYFVNVKYYRSRSSVRTRARTGSFTDVDGATARA